MAPWAMGQAPALFQRTKVLRETTFIFARCVKFNQSVHHAFASIALSEPARYGYGSWFSAVDTDTFIKNYPTSDCTRKELVL